MSESPLYPKEYLELIARTRSVVLSTMDSEGITQASYTPVVIISPTEFYILVSELASHTAYLRSAAKIGVMFIEDEQDCENIFRRRRASVSCEVIPLERSSETFDHVGQVFKERHGDVVDILLKLKDFHLFCLKVKRARLILGFGQAIDINFEEEI